MSDVMLLGVLRMPMPDNPADMGGLEWAQVKDRMRQAADEIEKERAAVDGHIRLIEVLEDEVARLRAELAAEREQKLEAIKAVARAVDMWTAADEKVTKLREALEPLKASADRADSDDLADTDATYVVVAHLRHARTVLEETGE
jgi:chromosome segregation ATPase